MGRIWHRAFGGAHQRGQGVLGFERTEHADGFALGEAQLSARRAAVTASSTNNSPNGCNAAVRMKGIGVAGARSLPATFFSATASAAAARAAALSSSSTVTRGFDHRGAVVLVERLRGSLPDRGIRSCRPASPSPGREDDDQLLWPLKIWVDFNLETGTIWSNPAGNRRCARH